MLSGFIFTHLFIFAASQTLSLEWCQQNVFNKYSSSSSNGPEFKSCLEFLREENENKETEIPLHSTPTKAGFSKNPNCDRKSAFIFLTGLGRKYQTACKIFATSLGLHLSENIIRCPPPPEKKTDILKFLPDLVEDVFFPNAWFLTSMLQICHIFS